MLSRVVARVRIVPTRTVKACRFLQGQHAFAGELHGYCSVIRFAKACYAVEDSAPATRRSSSIHLYCRLECAAVTVVKGPVQQEEILRLQAERVQFTAKLVKGVRPEPAAQYRAEVCRA